MRLQILTPHYKEEPWEMAPLLNSIAMQIAVDFREVGMIIVYDGEEATPLPEEDWKGFPFEIKYVRIPHGGVSAARNAALDAATADYVMYCDADDCFFHLCGLNMLFREMAVGFDSLTTMFIEETRHPQTGEPVFVQHPNDTTFVHGKIHRREYLVENGIRWNPELTIHEDSYFNVLARCVSKDPNRVKYLSQGVYMWRWRQESICRKDPEYIQKTYGNLINSNDALVEEFLRRGMTDHAKFYTAATILAGYFDMNEPQWLESKYREEAERRVGGFYTKHRELWDAVPAQQKVEMSNDIRPQHIRKGMQIEQMSLPEWLRHIEMIGGTKC